jgi:preprotein translocase subunit SecB
MTDPNRDPGLGIVEIILLSATFTHRPDALSLPRSTQLASMDLEFSAQVQAQGSTGPAVLVVGVTSKKDDPAALYQFDLKMAVVVAPDPAAPNLPPAEFLAQSGLQTVFPFVREAIANLTMRGRFGPVWLKPVNVRTLSQRMLEDIREKLSPEEPKASKSKAKPAKRKSRARSKRAAK